MGTPPITRSPGNLFLRYTRGTAQHTTSLAYLAGVNVFDQPSVAADARAFVNAVRVMTPGDTTFTGYGVRRRTGGVLYEVAFTPPVSGGGTNHPTMQAYYSTTVTVNGKAAGDGAGGSRGATRCVVFVGGVFEMFPASKVIAGTDQPNIQPLIDFLTTNLRLFADFYGQHADPTGHNTVQWNAHAQKHLGS